MLTPNDFIIIDDCVSKRQQDIIENWLLSPDSMWAFQKDIALNDDSIKKLNLQSKFGFSKSIYSQQKGVQDNIWPMVLSMTCEIMDKAKIEFDSVLFSRSFLVTPILEINEIDKIHVDTTYPHLVCLYYVNENISGDTIFYDKCFSEILTTLDYDRNERLDLLDYVDENVDKSTWQVIKNITPKKGRAVIFNGDRYHSVIRPKKGFRLAVNTCLTQL